MPPEVTTSGGGSGGGGGGGGGEGGGGGGGSGSGGGCDWEEEELRCCCSSSQDGQSGPFPCLHRPLLADLARNARMAPRILYVLLHNFGPHCRLPARQNYAK